MGELLSVILGGGREHARAAVGASQRSGMSVFRTMGEIVHQGALPGVRARLGAAVGVSFGGGLGVLGQYFFPVLL